MKRTSAFLALAVGFLTAASVQAVPTTYQYTGNPFTNVTAPYTTSDFVSAMVTLAGPLAPNMPFTTVTPTAFTLSDGVQTITNLTLFVQGSFQFATGPTGAITVWHVFAAAQSGQIASAGGGSLSAGDGGNTIEGQSGANTGSPGTWVLVSSNVPDTGSTLSLMTLTLMALGVAARRFQRAAA